VTPVARVGDATGHDSFEMAQVGIDIDRDAVERHPALEPHAMAAILSSKPAPLSGRPTQTPTRVLRGVRPGR